MTATTPVRLTKLSAENAGPLPVAYWLEGTLGSDLTQDKSIVVLRTRRNRQYPDEPEVVECPGLFRSSPIQQLETQSDDSVIVMTRNSHWRIERLAA